MRIATLLLTLLLAAPAARGDFMLLREWQSYDPVSRDVSVTILFSEAPDLAAGDGFGYYFGFQDYPENLEHHDLKLTTEGAAPGTLLLRYGGAASPPLQGQIAGEVPLTLDGDLASFTFPGTFSRPPVRLIPNAPYTLVAFEGGVPSGDVYQGRFGLGVYPIPEPPSLAMVALGAAMAVAMARRMR